jgi:hypothetical protein
MAAGDTTDGRRVANVGELEKPGDYTVAYVDGELAAIWFILPGDPEMSWGRIAAEGHGSGDEPEWSICEEADGSVTVSPSIQQHELGNVPYWHGHLQHGVWREV